MVITKLNTKNTGELSTRLNRNSYEFLFLCINAIIESSIIEGDFGMKLTQIKRNKMVYMVLAWLCGIGFYGLCIDLVLTPNLTFKPWPIGLGMVASVIAGYACGITAMKYDTRLKQQLSKR